MYSEPCATLITRVTPKMRVSPAATKNKPDAVARPFRAWKARPSTFMCRRYQTGAESRDAFRSAACACSIRTGRPQLLDLFVGRQNRSAIDKFVVDHDACSVLDTNLADVTTERRLVIDGAEDERPERSIHLEAAERLDHLFGVGRAGLGDASHDRL